MAKQSSGVVALLVLFMLSMACSACTSTQITPMTQPSMFHNPIASIADPFIIYHQGDYFLSGTSTGGSLQMWHGPHLGALGDGEGTTIWSPGADQPAYQVWSPTLFLLDNHDKRNWFLYFTAAMENQNTSHRIYVLQSSGENPLGPYTYKGQLGGTDDTTAIDPSILHIHNQFYLMYVLEKGNNAVYIAPMSDPLTVSGEPRLLIDPDQPWERGAGSGQSSYPVAEGPQALYHNGKTFIVYSGSDTGDYNYCLGLLTYDGSGNPLERSSWKKTGPVFQYSRANGVFGPGRAAFTTSPDGKQNWMVYHAKDIDDYTYDGRVTRAQEFSWNADGTPNFGVPVSVKTELAEPSGQ